MDDTDLISRLVEDGERWRGATEPSGDPVPLLVTHRSRRRLVPALLVAAAVLIIAVPVLVISLVRHNGSPSAADRPPASPCDGGQFGVDSAQLTGAVHVDLALTYRGAGACSISAYGPQVVVLDRSGATITDGVDATLGALDPPWIVVEPGARLSLTFTWWTWCGDRSDPIGSIELMLSNRGEYPQQKPLKLTNLGPVPLPLCDSQALQPGFRIAYPVIH
jgi:hypothetical protein